MTSFLALALLLVTGCRETPEATQPVALANRPSILLVTLDTTRADSIGPEAKGVETPAFNTLAARGTRFRYAYATAPQTLPSHASMMTGLYPAGHGIHENGRYLFDGHPLLAEQLRTAGYGTAAFVSAFPLARRFGLARGFEVYDDELPAGRSERGAKVTTDRALVWLARPRNEPVFLWVHYFDAHYPYEPPEPYRTKYASHPYRGEVAAMDAQLGRLVAAFEQRVSGTAAIIIAGDHGEGLGDHGESQHGNLIYQSTMHVPLIVVGPDAPAGVSEAPVSIRRIFHTLASWAGSPSELSLTSNAPETVLGEAMKPFLQYGWQPQVMAVDKSRKVINAGKIEVYDVASDPGETNDLGATAALPRELRKALRDYPIPRPGAPAGEAVSEEDRKRLASLGYVSSAARPLIRPDAPRPVDMAHLFEALDRASGLFVAEEYAAVIPLLEKILGEDPHNLDSALRIAVAHSALGHDRQALAAFKRAESIAPGSADVRNYLALHYARSAEWQKAVPLLERVIAEEPDRLPALEALATLRERQGRPAEALQLRQKIMTMKTPAAADLVRMGELAMAVGNTSLALQSFEKARQVLGPEFRHDLELGVLYVASRRYAEAREVLDRVPPSDPDYPMALFKRAQVSVLLREPDRAAKIAEAREHADAITSELIAREQLFR